jgi:hypothetical protein
MFLGHFAVGFGLKRAAPHTNLGWLVAAVCFLDLIWPVFLIAGIERVEIDPDNTAFTPLNFVSYPYSHSLLMAVFWSIIVGGIYLFLRKYNAGAIAVGIGVVSHWFLDAVVHRPDLPLYPGGDARVGFGLWNSVPATLLVEATMFAVGLYLYLRSTRAVNGKGVWVLWVLVAFLVVSYLSNALGPPPPSAEFLAYFTPLVWIFVFLAAWADRNRAPNVLIR